MRVRGKCLTEQQYWQPHALDLDSTRIQFLKSKAFAIIYKIRNHG